MIFNIISNWLTCITGLLLLRKTELNIMLFNKINQKQNLALYLQVSFNGIFHGLTQISDPMTLILIQPLAYPV